MVCKYQSIFFYFLHFQMNDIMLYTYPQQDGKYRLINRLSLAGMEVKLITFTDTSSVYSCIIVLGNHHFSIGRTLMDFTLMRI